MLSRIDMLSRAPRASHSDDDHPTIQEYHAWRKSPNTWRQGSSGLSGDIEQLHHDEGRRYNSPATLQQEFSRPRRVEELLNAIFANTDQEPPESEYVFDHFLRPFAILLCIGHGALIRHFIDFDLQDHYLPFQTEPPRFPTCTVCDLFSLFQEAQRQFCAVKLRWNMNTHLSQEEILPIKYEKILGHGGSAVAYKIIVDAEYDELVPKDCREPVIWLYYYAFVDRCLLCSKQVLSEANEHAYFLKTYHTEDAREYYNVERDAYIRLRRA